MKYQLAIFDMDGTILNTLEDLASSVNYALACSDFPLRTVEEVRKFVGNGMKKLIEHAVPRGSSEEAVDRVQRDFSSYYIEHCAEQTKPYDGILELLEALKSEGIRIAVVSNKPDNAVQELGRQYFAELFDAVAGERAGIAKKPAPDMVDRIREQLGILREKTIYIGDSEVDIETSRNADLDCVLVDWGFREAKFLKEQGAKKIVSSIDELKRVLLMEK